MRTPENPIAAQVSPRRRDRRRGAELLEFTLAMLPLLAMITVLIDTSWALFARSALQRAVRIGVRSGVTLTSAQMATGACLTDTVKGVVQANALGLLNGDTGLSKIKVNYLQPPAPSSTADAVDVSASANGNQPGNIMQVTVQNFSLLPLMPRLLGPAVRADNDPTVLTVKSADMIEPSRQPPCKGTAP
jgi:Flp pilus assembly protein TadG